MVVERVEPAVEAAMCAGEIEERAGVGRDGGQLAAAADQAIVGGQVVDVVFVVAGDDVGVEAGERFLGVAGVCGRRPQDVDTPVGKRVERCASAAGQEPAWMARTCSIVSASAAVLSSR